MTSAIETQQLVKHYTPEIRAVDGIDIDVPYGSIFGFLGANGSGKTTTVRMLTTLLRPTAGTGRVDGLDIERDAAAVRERIGVALQDASLDDLQTGRELLTLQARLYGVPSGQIKERVSHLLRIVDLEDAPDRTVKTYSGGMKRRLDLAAALVHSPKIVFLDEPTTGLDPISREAIWREVQALNKAEGVTFFLTTQYLEEADRLAGHVAIIDRGKIVAQGTPTELKSSIGTDVITVRVPGGEADVERAKAALGPLGATEIRGVNGSVVVYIKDGSTVIPRVVTLLNEASVAIEEVTLARPTLDDVFIRKTGHHLEAEEGVTQARAPDRQAQQ
jgi:ABC-2 type transport system ATP-binding protein